MPPPWGYPGSATPWGKRFVYGIMLFSPSKDTHAYIIIVNFEKKLSSISKM